MMVKFTKLMLYPAEIQCLTGDTLAEELFV